MDLKTLISNRVNMLGGSIPATILESTKIIIDLKTHPDPSTLKTEMNRIPANKIQYGKFYLIYYDYNGNHIWCPLFTLPAPLNEEYHPNVLYAVNISYIPFKFRIAIFDYIFKKHQSIIDYNDDIKNLKGEKNFKKVSFEYMYKLLKSITSGQQHSITGYNLAKIKICYNVSTKIADRFIMMNINKLNRSEMKNLYNKMTDSGARDKLGKVLEEYDKLLEEYQDETEEFYKKLKNLESYFKLLED